jgi:biotin transporter BioY
VHIAAVGWIYVTLMMAITEETVVAGIMTFFLYGVLPTLIIVYLGGSPQRRRRNEEARLRMMQERQNSAAQESKPDADGVK